MNDSKPSNPKDLIGSTKAPMSLNPATAAAEQSLAHQEGLTKYGSHNYRAIGVRSSIYLDAAARHLAKWQNGEERDRKTGVHHLGSVMACCAIVIDSQACGNLNDDRPPMIPGFSDYLDSFETRVRHLVEMHSDKNPKHYTIKDDIPIRSLSLEPVECEGQEYADACTEKADRQRQLEFPELAIDKSSPPLGTRGPVRGCTIIKRETLSGHTIDYVTETAGYIDGNFLTGTNFTSPVALYRAGYQSVDEEIEAINSQEAALREHQTP